MSDSADGYDFLTEQDLEKLSAAADALASGKSARAAVDKIDEASDEEALLEESIDLEVNFVSQFMSRRLYEHSEEETNAKAADAFGVSERTVERHRAYWNESDDKDAVSFTMRPPVTSDLCKLMRRHAHEGWSLQKLSFWYNLSKGAVHNHVSAATKRPCSHDVDEPRVEFHHGGMRGNGERQRNDAGQFSN